MGRPDFGRPTTHPTPLVAHALHDDDANVVDGDIVEVVHDGLPAKLAAKLELEPALQLGCRSRVPLTRVHNPYGVLLLYQDQLDAQTLNQVMVYVKVYGSIVISFIFKSTLLTSNVNVQVLWQPYVGELVDQLPDICLFN